MHRIFILCFIYFSYNSVAGLNEYKVKSGKDTDLYKTELCKNWESAKSCDYGDNCKFAHGKGELKRKNFIYKYKTEICKPKFYLDSCCFGDRCQFIHPLDVSEIPIGYNSENERVIDCEIVKMIFFYKGKYRDNAPFDECRE